MTYTPAQRRLVGGALRRHRERLGYRLGDAARVLDCHPSKISRLERGQRGIRRLELRTLLEEYGVDEQERKIIVTIGDPRGARGWWQDYADILSPAFRDYLLLESAAHQIRQYDSQRIPDLLQTAGYAQAITEFGMWLPEPQTRHRLAEMQLTRQQAVMSQGQLHIRVIIGEGALRRVVGSPDIMHAQIRQLIEIGTSCDRVTLHVLPMHSAARPVLSSGSLTILQFAGSAELGAVYMPTMSDVICMVSPAEVASCVTAFAELEAAALDPSTSLKMLRVLSG